MEIETMSATEVLQEIARRRRALMDIESELKIAKMDLKVSPLARQVKALSERRKLLLASLDVMLGDIRIVYQPRLDMGDVLDEVQRLINDGESGEDEASA